MTTKIFTLLSALLLLTSCYQTYEGHIDVKSPYVFDGKNDKSLDLKIGIMDAKLTVVGKKELKFTVKTDKKENIKFDFPFALKKLPTNGKVFISAKELGQDFDLLLTIKTTQTESKQMSGTQSCNDGRQTIKYHYLYTNSALTSDFLAAEEVLATFVGDYEKRDKIIDSKGPCRSTGNSSSKVTSDSNGSNDKDSGNDDSGNDDGGNDDGGNDDGGNDDGGNDDGGNCGNNGNNGNNGNHGNNGGHGNNGHGNGHHSHGNGNGNGHTSHGNGNGNGHSSHPEGNHQSNGHGKGHNK